MNLHRACLALLVFAPWLAVAGAAAVGYGLLMWHRLWWTAAGCAALVVAFEVSAVAYKVLKVRPAMNRAEVVRRLRERGWCWPGSSSGLGPPFEA